MKNEKQQPTELDSMGKLALAVAKASELCHPSACKTLLEACDTVEEDLDCLQADYDSLEKEYFLLEAKHDALKAEKEINPLLLEQADELLSKLPMSNDWALLSYGEQVVDYLVYAERAEVQYIAATQTDTLVALTTPKRELNLAEQMTKDQPKTKSEKNPPGTEQVSKVIAAWRANAKEAGMPEDSCYVAFINDAIQDIKVFYIDGHGDPDYRHEEISGPAWEIACNYERGTSLIWFTDQDVWLHRAPYSEGCGKMKGGLTEAIANAEIVYTG